MNLLGTVLYGNTIVQDGKREWLKIDGVTVGESEKFSYITANSRNIGGLLDQMNLDNKAVVIIYEWKSGKAYIKTGLDLKSSGDSKANSGFTSFIKANYLQLTQPVQNISATQTSPSGFLKLSDENITLDGKPFVAVGSNAYWLGYTEEHSYPSKEQIEEMFIAVSRMGGNTIRSHTLGHSSGRPNSLRPKDNNLNDNAWESIDYSFSMAKKYNIKIISPLTDGYSWYNGNYGDYTSNRGVQKKDFWTNGEVRNDFKDYINKYLNHYNKYNKCFMKDDPCLGIIELGNELGNIRQDSDSTTIPTFDWLSDISKYIKSIDPNHLILNPADECLGQSNEFSIPTLDCFGAHFYYDDDNRLNNGINMTKKAGKPYIVGEYSSFAEEDWYRKLENKGVKGSLFWSMYPHKNGIFGGERILHEDGFTIHYEKENEKFLLRIAKHFCRLKGVPEIQGLDFGKYVPEIKQEIVNPSGNIWSQSTVYSEGNVAYVGTQQYKCIRKHTSSEDTKPGVNNWEPVTITPQKPTVSITGKLQTLLKNKSPIGTYYQSWSAPWVSKGEDLDMTKIEPPINIVNISFCNPNCTYKKGSNSFNGTGVQFSSDFIVIKKSIEILRNKGVVVMLSVGGASYQFATYNAQNVSDLCNDLGCNGIDIDWEDENGFERFGTIISETRRVLPDGCVSTAGFSVGAYGENQFKNSPPLSSRTGMNIQGLKSNGEKLDWINIMTYDASPVLDPIEAFKAYRSFYKGPLLIGEEVPEEAWGGNIITLGKVAEHSKYVSSQGKENGIFTWSYQKQGTPSSKEILETASKILI